MGSSDEREPERASDGETEELSATLSTNRNARAAERGPRDGSDEEGGRRNALLVAGLVGAAAAVVALVLVGFRDKGTYSKSVDELVAQKAQYVDKPVRVEGMLVHGTLQKRDTPCEYRFTIEKNGTQMPVRFPKCVVPDTFRDVPGVDLGVTVEGRLLADQSLEATQVLAKCPSKYDMKQKAAAGETAPHAMPSL